MTTTQLTFGIPVDVQLRRARKAVQSDPLPGEMVKAFYEHKGEVNLLWGMECKHAQAIIKGGFTVAQVLACYDYLATDKWYADNGVDITLVTVRKKIAGWVKRGSLGMASSPRPDGARKLSSSEYDRRWAAHVARRGMEGRRMRTYVSHSKPVTPPLFTWRERLAAQRLAEGMPLELVVKMSGSTDAERLSENTVKTVKARWDRQGQI